MNLQDFDLNLLVTLDALLAERSVTRAARRVGLSQPAMSNALARLRAALGDPVLVRAKGAMVPTTKAEELGRAASLALRELRRTLGDSGVFEPALSERVFTIAASDYVICVLLPPLLEVLARDAPRISLRFVPLEPEISFAKLESGVDFMLGFFRHTPASLHRAALFSDRNVIITRRGHPFLKTRRTLRDLSRFRHLRVASQGEPRGLMDPVLAKRGLHRVVVVTAPQFLLTQVIGSTDLLAFVPERLAQSMSGVEIVALPWSLPRLKVDAYWHARWQHDPAHAWLRKQLAAAVRV